MEQDVGVTTVHLDVSCSETLEIWQVLISFLNFLDCRENCTDWQLESKTIKDNHTCTGLYSRRCTSALYEQIKTEYSRREIGKSNWICQFDAGLAHQMQVSIVEGSSWNGNIANSKLVLCPFSLWSQHPFEDHSHLRLELIMSTSVWGFQALAHLDLDLGQKITTVEKFYECYKF